MMTVVIDLIQTMIVVGRRIEGTHKGSTIYTQGSFFAFGQEITSLIAIRITRTKGGGVAAPAYRSLAVEQTLAVHRASGNFLQVIGSGQVAAHQLFVLQVSTITIYFHAVYIAEPSLFHQLRRQLIDTR